MYWKTPDIQHVTGSNSFTKEKSNYGFIYEAVGKKYNELADFAIDYYDKSANPKYFGQISTFLNFLGFIELDSEMNVVKNELLARIFERKSPEEILCYMNYFLCQWQFPAPNIAQNRDVVKSKPYLLVLKTLLKLSERNPKEGYLTKKDFYLIYENPTVHRCKDITEGYIDQIIQNRNKTVEKTDNQLNRLTSYYGALLSESYLLTGVIEDDNNQVTEVMIALRKGERIRSIAEYLVMKYGESFFEFDPNIPANDKAVLSEWALYINSRVKFQEWKENYMTINDVYDFESFCKDRGFYYSKNLIRRFIMSLDTKPFLILTGISGSGKTKIAELWSKFKNPDGDRGLTISVGSNWTDNKKLLGFKNILQEEGSNYISTQLVELIARANVNDQETFIVIFDEMNLSHVERYFSDFLAALESINHEIVLPNGDKVVWTKNIKIIGTVNIDETTYMFSPKVLDRANVIEMNGIKPSEYIDSVIDKQAKIYVEIKDKPWFGKYRDLLDETYNALNRNFAYRVIDEISLYTKRNCELFGDENFNSYFDEQIYQKILPKLHGSRAILKPQLEALKKVLNECDAQGEKMYKLSVSKIDEMMLDIQQGYASFNRR